MRRKQDALADAEEAVSCDPSFVKGFLRRASAHEALEQWEEAVHDYEKVRCCTASASLRVCAPGFEIGSLHSDILCWKRRGAKALSRTFNYKIV